MTENCREYLVDSNIPETPNESDVLNVVICM